MLSVIMGLIGAIPGIGSIVTSLTSAFFNAKVAITTARIGGDRDVAVELVRTGAVESHESTQKLSLLAGNKILVWLVVAFAAPLVIYEWDVIVVDKVLKLGTTDPIKGQVADWANTIIISIFGTSTAVTLGSMWFNRKTPA